MYSYQIGPTLGAGGERTRMLLAAGAGALVGYVAPKIMAKFQAMGMSPEEAKAATERVVAGVAPPPKGAMTPDELAALKQAQAPAPGGMPGWLLPVGIGAVVIGAMAMRR